ncbi:MAG: DNA-binding protein [Candidatus Marsarchaeota archaeon]|nr:DNA-binding protein [Candidatus Marsarchaeota archaeon]
MPDNTEDAARKELNKRLKAIQLEQQKRLLAKRYMTEEAYERLMNVRVSNYDLYMNILNMIISTAQSGRFAERITEKQLVEILSRLTYKPEPKIEFKRK